MSKKIGTAFKLDNLELVREVKNKPVLWNPENEDYSNQNKRTEAWIDICTKLINNFEYFNEKAKDTIIKAITSEWFLLQDTYKLSMKFAEKDAIKPIPILTPFQEQFNFLNGESKTNEEQNQEVQNQEEQNQEVQNQEEQRESVQPSVPVIYPSCDNLIVENETSNDASSDTSTLPPNEKIYSATSFLSRYLTEKKGLEKVDEDLAFFHSVLPAIDNLTMDSVFPFRREIVDTVLDIHTKL